MLPEARELLDFILMESVNVFEVEPEELLGKSRYTRATLPRHAFMYAIATHINENRLASLQELGDFIKRDHSTIIHSRKQMLRILKHPVSDAERAIGEKLRQLDPLIAKKRDEILERMKKARVPSYGERLAAIEELAGKLDRDFQEIKLQLNGKFSEFTNQK